MSREKLSDSPLKKVVWQAVIDGPLMSYTSSQQYHNDRKDPVEINYSFPLPYGKSVISKFRANINGVVREGKAYPKKEAEQKYEDAIESGDTPIMLEITEKDFCTASLGNILPGEDASIELEYFQLLNYCDHKLRLTIPTVIGERYASDIEEQPFGRFEITHNFFADYDLDGSVLLKGALAKGKISSPTHSIEVQKQGEDIVVRLLGAKLDKDLVLDIEAPLESSVYVAKDDSGWAAAANFILSNEPAKLPLDLSILADCSGSMGGSRINWMKQALKKLNSKFGTADQVSLAAFGTSVELKLLPNRMKFEEFQGNFAEAVSYLEADLGGTELEQAIVSCMNLFPGRNKQSAMLLLTDGEVWDSCKPMIRAALEAKRRIFILGIGMAPYNNLLVELAEKTGGAYEAVYNWYDIEGAVERMLKRIRSEVAVQPEIHWRAPKFWSSKKSKSFFTEDNYTGFAFLKELPECVKLSWKEEGKIKEIGAKVISHDYGYQLCQLVAAQRMLSTDIKEEKRDIGVKYNIAGPETNFFLSFVREENEKGTTNLDLMIVPQMVPEDNWVLSQADPDSNNIRFHKSSRRCASRSAPSLYDASGAMPLSEIPVDETEDPTVRLLLDLATKLDLSFQASDVDMYVTHSYDFLSKFGVVKKELVEFVRRIDQRLTSVFVAEALPKGYYLEGAITEVEDKAGTLLPTFDETEDISKLDPEAFTAFCVFIFFAARGNYEEIDASFHSSLLTLIRKTIRR